MLGRKSAASAAVLTVLLLSSCGGQQTASSDPPPETVTPGTIVRQAQFDRSAVALVGCTAARANQGSNVVIGDLELVGQSYPKAQLPPANGATIYVAMELLNKNDAVPLWVLTGRDMMPDVSYIELRMGYSPKAGKAREAELWRIVEACSEATT
ncbi:MAG TPA: hypothetical protein VH835_10580 [Dongiaceae bacterium]|jgi:hypothetical protein